MAIVTWGIAAALALATGIALYLLITTGTALFIRWRQNRRRHSLASFIAATTRAETEGEPEATWQPDGKILTLLGVDVLTALYAGAHGGILVSIGLLISGAVTVLYSRKRAQMAQYAQLTDQVAELLNEYYSRWLLNASPFGVLEDIGEHITFGQPLDGIIRRVLSRYRLGEPDALAPLRGTDPYLQQFGYILAQTTRSGNRVTADAINEVLQRLRMRHKLQKRVATVTALTRGEEMFLLVANTTAIALALALPLLREFYTSSLLRQLVLAAAIVIITAGGIYFDFEIESLKEKAL